MAIEIVEFPMKKGGSFHHSYVNVYQRVYYVGYNDVDNYSHYTILHHYTPLYTTIPY